MKRLCIGVASLLPLFAAVVIAACGGSTPTNPELAERVPVRFDLFLSRESLPPKGAEVTVVVQLQLEPGVPAEGIPVEIALRPTNGEEVVASYPTNSSGAVSPSFRLVGPTTVIARAAGLERSKYLPQASDPEPPVDPPAPPDDGEEPEDDDDPSPAPPAPEEPALDAKIFASETTTDIYTSVVFSVASTASGGAKPVSQYEWDFDSDGTIDQIEALYQTSYQFPALGTYAVRVRVSNGTQSAWADPIEIIVDEPPIIVNLTSDLSTAAVGQFVEFTATALSAGPLPMPLRYEWDLDNDGSYDDADVTVNSDEQSQSLNFLSVGTKRISVKVTDPVSGRTAVSSLTISVS